MVVQIIICPDVQVVKKKIEHKLRIKQSEPIEPLLIFSHITNEILRQDEGHDEIATIHF
jgi:hypothetical protein